MLKNIIFIISIIIIFIGCGGGSGGSSSTVNKTGYFIDSAVQGVEYTCRTISGKTGDNGEFEYTDSCEIELKIGNLLLGKISSNLIRDNRLYPSDLARVNRNNITNLNVRYIIRVLQSLDSNNDPSDGITIEQSTIDKFSNIETLDLSNPNITEEKEEEITKVLTNLGFYLIDEETALEHYKNTLLNDLGITPTAENTPSASIYINATVSEDSTAGTIITTIPLSSIVTNTVASIQITGIGYENFDVALDGTITLSSSSKLDYDVKNIYTLESLITDSNKNQITAQITIELIKGTKDNNAPIITNQSSINVDENQISALTITASDELPITYSLSGTDSSYFNTNSTTGVVTFKDAPDFETKTSYSITLIATDSLDNFSTKDLIININDLDDITLVFNPIDSTEPISEYEILTNPPENALNIYNKSLVKIGIYSSSKKNENNIDNLYDYYTNSGYTTTFFGNNATTKRLTDFSSDSLENLDLLIIFQPTQALNDSEIEILSNLLDNGGRIFFIGEHNNYSPTENINISSAVVALGGGVTVLGGSYQDDDKQSNSDNQKNLNYSVLLSGVSNFVTSYYAQLELKGNITQAVIVDDSNRILMAEQGVSNGRITLIADQNWFDTGKLNSSSNQNDIFLENLAISSYIHTDFVDFVGNPNTQAVDYLKFEKINENAPIISNISSITVNENQTSALTISASDESTITYSLGGKDSSYFNINNSSGVVTFKNAPDFETRNSYNITLIARDSLNNTSSKNIIININNINEDNSNPLLTAKALASDGADYDQFGSSVAISGDYIVIGAPYDNDKGNSSGSVYIFKKQINGSLEEIAKLTASNGLASDYFGYAVSISGDYIIIGASGDDENGKSSGSAYVFKNNGNDTFTEISKLTASDGGAYDYFGKSISISGDYIVIGAHGDGGNSNGSAYIFKNNGNDTFVQIEKIVNPDATAYDYFGYAVSISGNYIVVGANADDDKGEDSGSAYIFKNNGNDTFTQISKLTASDGMIYNSFGKSVSISGNYLVIGTFGNSDFGGYANSSYLFKNDGNDNFTQLSKLTVSDNNNTYNHFGKNVAISGNNIIVSASLDNTNGNQSGSAYLFDINAEDKPYILNFKQNVTVDDNGSIFVADYFSSSMSGSTFTYSLSGIDSQYLNINKYTGELNFNNAPNYYNPDDYDSDNIYNVDISVTDEQGKVNTYSLNIHINT